MLSSNAQSQLCLRAFAGFIAGYGCAMSVSVLVATLLPVGRADSVLFALMIGIALYVLCVFWAFVATSVVQAWLGLLLPTCAAAAFLFSF